MTKRLRQTIATRHSDAAHPRLGIESLVDVAFLLLIYFLVTTTLMDSEADLEIKVPSYNGTALPQLEPLTLAIEDDGNLVLAPGRPQQESLDLGSSGREVPLLDEVLANYRVLALSQNGDFAPMVIIDPAPGVASQRFVDVVNAAIGEGLENISFTLFPRSQS